MISPLQAQLQRRSVSSDSLAELGISPPRARELLNGADPTISEVRRISDALHIPIRSLITERPSSVKAQFKLRENFKSALDPAYEVFDLLSRAESLSDVLPRGEDVRVSFDVGDQQKSFENAEYLAAICRLKLLRADELIPLIDLETRIADYTDAHVIISNERSLEGAVIAYQEHGFVFLSPRPDPRMRFTLAHELCHYLVDLPVSENGGWFDEDVFENSAVYRRDEWFANSFASALLLPPPGVGETLQTFRLHHKMIDQPVSDYEVMFLAIVFGVSFQVAARRLEDLRILPPGAAQSLYDKIRSKYGSPEKFAESLRLPKRAAHEWGSGIRRLLSEVKEAVSSGQISIGRLAEIIEWSVADVSKSLAQ